MRARREIRRKPERADERRTIRLGHIGRQLWMSKAAALLVAASERAPLVILSHTSIIVIIDLYIYNLVLLFDYMKTILIDAVYTFIIETKDGNFEIFEQMYRMLEKFSNRKIILTGANNEKFKKYGLDKMPYEVFTLQHNPEKTDSEYFKILVNKYDLAIKDLLYFEHSKEAIDSAQSLGIKSFYYDPEQKDLDSLKRFLDENSN